METGHVSAGKIVSKQLLIKPHQKDKMAQEISIHRSLKHEHIVGFHSYFEDNNFVYIVLELCKRRVTSIPLQGSLNQYSLFLSIYSESNGAPQTKKSCNRARG